MQPSFLSLVLASTVMERPNSDFRTLRGSTLEVTTEAMDSPYAFRIDSRGMLWSGCLNRGIDELIRTGQHFSTVLESGWKQTGWLEEALHVLLQAFKGQCTCINCAAHAGVYRASA